MHAALLPTVPGSLSLPICVGKRILLSAEMGVVVSFYSHSETM